MAEHYHHDMEAPQEAHSGEHSMHHMSEVQAAQPAVMDHAAHEQHVHEAEHDHAGHGGAHTDHTGHEMLFRNRFWVNLLLTIPVLLFSPMLQDWFGFEMPGFTGDQVVG
ncbi:MAG TPA: hypothetical protein VHO48_06215, partial [Anaerolineaceae bacterium]|nr:hypothetical protein [Anaerolineaceae bacterium]